MTRQEDNEVLRQNLKSSKESLTELLTSISGPWTYEDLIYRFYHQSFKVYWMQGATLKIVEALRALAPPEKEELDSYFTQIISEGTGIEFDLEHNDRWLEVTRPILEAFFHAKYFLEMAVKYSDQADDENVGMIDSGWAAFLYLYHMRY